MSLYEVMWISYLIRDREFMISIHTVETMHRRTDLTNNCQDVSLKIRVCKPRSTEQGAGPCWFEMFNDGKEVRE